MRKNYEFVMTSLYGSQNYNLDTKTSDHDFKMAVVPSINNLILDKKPYVKIEETKNGIIEVKDIRHTFLAFKKMSVVDLEMLFSKVITTNKKYKEELDRLISMREEIVASNPYSLYNTMLGIMISGSKRKYTPKTAAQSMRYYDLFDRYFVKNENFKSALDTSKSELYELIKNTKTGKIPEDVAMEKIEEMIAITKSYEDKIDKNINYETNQKLDLILIDIFKKRINEKETKTENMLRERWTKSYDSAIFGKYELTFKVYEEKDYFIIKIENSLTTNVYTVKDKFDTYDNAVDWMGHIKDNLINVNNEDLIDLIQ